MAALIAELKRRNVHRMAGLYLVGAWLVVQVAETLFPLFGFDETPARICVIVLAIGFLPAMVFAWLFELTPEGLRRESEIDRTQSITPQTGRRMDRLIMEVLALALCYFAVDKFLLAPRREAALERQKSEAVEAAREEGRSEALVESYGARSIAVLPFLNMSNDPDQEYFSDGITEEVLNLLARIPELRVISRSSAFAFKGKDIEIPEIASRLNVAHILEGSVRKSGNRVRITAQLIEARSDTHLWSATWDRELDDIFAVQDEIAAAAVSQLKVRLLGDAPKSSVVNSQAYVLYLQARQLGRLNTPEAYEESITLYRQALAAEPDYAAAWNGLAASYINQMIRGLRPPSEGLPLAREAAEKAIAADHRYAPAFSLLGWISMIGDGDLATAASRYERALTLDPTNPAVVGNAAYLSQILGRPDEAISLGAYQVSRDPANPVAHGNLGAMYLLAGRPDEAIASLRSALRLAPGYNLAHFNIAMALLAKGDTEAALAELQEESSEGERLVGLAMIYHRQGRKAESDAALAELIEEYGDPLASSIAAVLAYRNESDRAFEWLDRALAQDDQSLVEAVLHPEFAHVHDDPRWVPLLRRLGLAPDQLADLEFEAKVPGLEHRHETSP
jgi:adenylate cyclase